MVFALFPLNNFQVAPDHFEIGALLVVSGDKMEKVPQSIIERYFSKTFYE